MVVETLSMVRYLQSIPTWLNIFETALPKVLPLQIKIIPQGPRPAVVSCELMICELILGGTMRGIVPLERVARWSLAAGLALLTGRGPFPVLLVS